jgi:hypothetical protein
MQYLGWYIMLASFFVFVIVVFIVAYHLRRRCPECRGDVKEMSKEATVHPTEVHPGIERTKYKCIKCEYEYERLKYLPKLGAWVPAYGTEKRSTYIPDREETDGRGYKGGYARMARDAGQMYRMFGGGKSSGTGSSKKY